MGPRNSPETIAKIRASKMGSKNSSWKGGRRKYHGYITILCPDHPFADLEGYVREHRLIMESHLGRTLLPTEVVHHINCDRSDNRIENLMLFSGVGEHISHHGKVRGGEL